MKFRDFLSEVIKSDYANIIVTNKGDNISIIDSVTGGRALIKIVQHFNYEKKDYEGMSIVIISWNAAPLTAVMDKGLDGRNEYVGGGFARNVMRKIIEIALEQNILILEIFGPSPYSNAVLNNYTKKGLLSPIPYSKAVLGDFHTAFQINPSKARQFIDSFSN